VQPAPPPQERRPDEPTVLRWVFGASAGAAVGIVRPAAPALLVDAALERAPLSIAVGVFGVPPQGLDLGPGTVDVQLLAATARGCIFAGRRTMLGLCARAAAGAVHARGSGYDTNTDSTRPWIAVGPEGFVGVPVIAPLRLRAAAAALVPLHAETFSVGGAGVAYDTPAVGALLTVSVEVAP
jgi:hypothetical protein